MTTTTEEPRVTDALPTEDGEGCPCGCGCDLAVLRAMGEVAQERDAIPEEEEGAR